MPLQKYTPEETKEFRRKLATAKTSQEITDAILSLPEPTPEQLAYLNEYGDLIQEPESPPSSTTAQRTVYSVQPKSSES